MFDGKAEEREQLVRLVGDLRCGLRPLLTEGVCEALDRPLGVRAILCLADLAERLVGYRLGRFRQGVQHVRRGWTRPSRSDEVTLAVQVREGTR